MTTIAELQVKVDSTQVETSTKALNAFATAAEKAAKARKALNDANNAGGGGGGNNDSEVRKSKNLSEAIDAQVRKLANLERQRKALNDSPLKTEDPEKYKRLNQEIDARTELVRRQGNSLDRLAAQAKKEQEQRERASQAAKRLADREARESQQKEEREARFAAAQDKRLSATLGSLSRQIKAVEEYNRTLATLNAARAPTTGTASLGQAQYETYVKLAQATRDAALAQADNSKEIERAQRAYDSSVASLGKVERAQALYAKNLRDSDKALALGLITQEQYNAKLTAFATKRDSTIAAANNNADAEARLAAQLRNVLSAYDPVLRATDAYNNSVKVLAQGLQNGKVSVEQFNKALTDQRNALEAVKASQSNSPETQAKNYQAALDRLLPLNAQLRNLNEAERILTQTRAAGHLTTEQQIKDYERATKAIAAERAEIERKNMAEKRGNSAKQDAAALRGLPAQFTDVVVSLQGGQAPLTVLLQQGGQVKDLFGGIVPALKAVGGALLALVTPWTVAAAGIATVGYAFLAAKSEITEFNKAAASSNNFSGVTTMAFQGLQKAVSETVGTLSLAAETLTLLERSGKVTSDQFEAISVAAIKFSRVTGKAVSEIVDEFASLAKEPTQAVLTLDEKYKFLTGSVYLQIAALERQGDTLAATTLAQSEAAKGVESMADRILPNLSLVEKGWKLVTDAVKGTRDAIINFGREAADPVQAELDSVNKKLSVLGQQKIDPFGLVASRKSDLNFQREALEAQVKWTKELNSEKDKKNSLDERARQTQLDLAKASKATLDQNMTSVERYGLAISALEQRQTNAERDAIANGTTLKPEVIKQTTDALEVLRKKLKDAQEQEANSAKGKTTPLDTTGIQDVKSNLSVLLSEYDGYYKKATALGQANVVSAEATKASQIAILKSEATAVTEEYDKQIAAIKKLQAQKGNNAAQNISLTNQLTRAEDQRTKFVQDNAAKQQKVEIEAQAVIDKRVRSVKAYVDALNDQIDAERRAGERAVKAVSGSDSENALNDKLSANDDRYVADQKKLADQLAEGAINAEEYREKLAALGDAYSKMSDTIQESADNIKLANQDWQAGATRGFKQYIEEGQNAAKLIEGFVKDSLDSMTDALSTFVLTGKLDFKSLASSIISDLTKIAVKIAFTQALSTIFGGFSGGVSTGAISGFSETISTPYAQAKGGGWSQGTQFFAKGGAFTNGIVNSATSFGMSGGGQGVMGEAGPEAIVPLARAADGSLGVRMIGGAQEGGAVGAGGIYININIASDGQVDTTSSDPGLSQFGKELGDFVDRRYKILLAQDLKDGGAIKTSIRQQ